MQTSPGRARHKKEGAYILIPTVGRQPAPEIRPVRSLHSMICILRLILSFETLGKTKRKKDQPRFLPHRR